MIRSTPYQSMTVRVLVADLPIGPGCSNSHIPGYIKHPKLKDAGDVFVIAVNDPFVLASIFQSLSVISDSASDQLDPAGKSGVSSQIF